MSRYAHALHATLSSHLIRSRLIARVPRPNSFLFSVLASRFLSSLIFFHLSLSIPSLRYIPSPSSSIQFHLVFPPFPPVRFFIPTLSLRALFGSCFSSPRPSFLRILSIFSSFVFLFPPISTPTCVRLFASPGFVSLHLIPSLHDVHSILSHPTEVSRHLAQPSHSPLFDRQGSFISGSGQRKSRPS